MTDYGPVIRDLEMQVEQIEGALKVLRSLAGVAVALADVPASIRGKKQSSERSSRKSAKPKAEAPPAKDNTLTAAQLVLHALQEHGPLTAAELKDRLVGAGFGQSTVYPTLNTLKNADTIKRVVDSGIDKWAARK